MYIFSIVSSKFVQTVFRLIVFSTNFCFERSLLVLLFYRKSLYNFCFEPCGCLNAATNQAVLIMITTYVNFKLSIAILRLLDSYRSHRNFSWKHLHKPFKPLLTLDARLTISQNAEPTLSTIWWSSIKPIEREMKENVIIQQIKRLFQFTSFCKFNANDTCTLRNYYLFRNFHELLLLFNYLLLTIFLALTIVLAFLFHAMNFKTIRLFRLFKLFISIIKSLQ